MNNRPIYLDNCASTKIDPEVLAVMVHYFQTEYGNAASSSHVFGWNARTAVDQAGEEIAALIGAKSREIVFTSGATESNNLAILGFARGTSSGGKHLITCVTEHKSVLDSCLALEPEGWNVTYLPVDRDGRISLEELASAIKPGETRLISLMLVNNETGVIQPIEEISVLCRQYSIKLHVDATQAVGKIPVDVNQLGVDLLSFSAHKMHGPKGVGALFVRRSSRLKIEALIHGGRHQGDLRSGTLPVPLIVGMGLAARLVQKRLQSSTHRLSTLRDRLEKRILESIPEAVIHGAAAPRSPVVSNIGFPGVDGEDLLIGLRNVAASAGSACTSASGQPSYVLLAMKVDRAVAKASLRLSVSHLTTESEIDLAVAEIVELVHQLRNIHLVAA